MDKFLTNEDTKSIKMGTIKLSPTSIAMVVLLSSSILAACEAFSVDIQGCTVEELRLSVEKGCKIAARDQDSDLSLNPYGSVEPPDLSATGRPISALKRILTKALLHNRVFKRSHRSSASVGRFAGEACCAEACSISVEELSSLC